jgi:hypothetical protein
MTKNLVLQKKAIKMSQLVACHWCAGPIEGLENHIGKECERECLHQHQMYFVRCDDPALCRKRTETRGTEWPPSGPQSIAELRKSLE